jgi:hypothetical protein
MSLSDYSSDEGWEDEEGIAPEAIRSVGSKMKASMSSGSTNTSSMVVRVLAKFNAHCTREVSSPGAYRPAPVHCDKSLRFVVYVGNPIMLVVVIINVLIGFVFV